MEQEPRIVWAPLTEQNTPQEATLKEEVKENGRKRPLTYWEDNPKSSNRENTKQPRSSRLSLILPIVVSVALAGVMLYMFAPNKTQFVNEIVDIKSSLQTISERVDTLGAQGEGMGALQTQIDNLERRLAQIESN